MSRKPSQNEQQLNFWTNKFGPLPKFHSPKEGQKRGFACVDISALIFRWGTVLVFAGFVTRGWILSFGKYTSGQTSLSLIKNESDSLRYPSVTFCPMFKRGIDLTDQILDQQLMDSCYHNCGGGYDWRMECFCSEECVDQGKCCEDYEEMCLGNETSVVNTDKDLMLDDVDLEKYLDEWSWQRSDFITFFTHSEDVKPGDTVDILKDDTYWMETIPHVYHSGKCFTYDPPFDSKSGWKHGIRFGLKLPLKIYDKSIFEREKLLKDMMHIYVHERNRFAFSTQDDFPSSHKLDMSWLRFRHENGIDLDYRIYTAFDRIDRPCTSDPNYDFTKCIDQKYSEWRGCQAPWNHYDDSDIPMCTNVTAIKHHFKKSSPLGIKNFDQPYQSPLSSAKGTNCPLPCTTAIITPSFSYNSLNTNDPLNTMTNGTDWTVHLWFKNFQFTYETEYKVCDWTCLVGEIGGNLGFFLGGSVLASIDLLLALIAIK